MILPGLPGIARQQYAAICIGKPSASLLRYDPPALPQGTAPSEEMPHSRHGWFSLRLDGRGMVVCADPLYMHCAEYLIPFAMRAFDQTEYHKVTPYMLRWIRDHIDYQIDRLLESLEGLTQ